MSFANDDKNKTKYSTIGETPLIFDNKQIILKHPGLQLKEVERSKSHFS